MDRFCEWTCADDRAAAEPPCERCATTYFDREERGRDRVWLCDECNAFIDEDDAA